MESHRAVLLSLLSEGPATRPLLAARTRLSKPTVSEAVRRLVARGIVTGLGPRHGSLGRAPQEFGISPDVGRVVGVDVGGSWVRVVAADVTGRLVRSTQQPTVTRSWEAVLHQVEQMVGEVLAGGPAAGQPLALGVSTTGVVCPSTQRVSHAYAIDHEGEFDLLAALRRRWDVPVQLENNVNCAALGEHWRGRATVARSLAFVSVGAGVGLGLLLDGRVLRGAHGAAGEIAYLPLVPGDGGAPRAQLEQQASASGILARGRAAGPSQERAASTVEEVFARAAGGDPVAGKVVAEEAALIGDAVASVCAVVDPELVVLGGGIGSNPRLLEPVRAAVAELLPYPPAVEVTALGVEASVHGAVALALRSARAVLLARVLDGPPRPADVDARPNSPAD